MAELSIPILQQPRLTLVLPVGIVVAAILGANVVWFVGRAAGAPRAVGGVGAVLCIGVGIALAIRSSVGIQGTVRTDSSGRLEVDARFRGARQVRLTGAEVRRFVWRQGHPPSLLVGVYVRVSDPGGNVTIGASDPGLAADFEEAGAELTTVPPSVTVAPEDFRRLLAALPGPRGGGGGG